ncbi:acyl dehydratase, partial [Vibrio vulnificus]
MAIAPDAVGRVLPSTETAVPIERLRFFADAIGEKNPIYTD